MVFSWGTYSEYSTNPDDMAKELKALRQEFDGIRGVVNSWTGGVGTDPYFNYLRANHTRFDFPPLQSATLRSSAGISIPNGDWTVLNWNEANNNDLLEYSSATGQSSNVLVKGSYGPNNAIDLLVAGVISFDANSSGPRAVGLDDLPISTAANDNVVQLPATVGGDTVLSFCRVVTCFASTGLQGLAVTVYQNSGGSLNLAVNRAQLSVLLLGRRST